jgi:DedD protein
MDETLKNRLVGVAVVTVLAVIFLPMMFEDPVEKKGQEVAALEIPKKDEVSPSLKTEIVPTKPADVLPADSQPQTATVPAKTGTVFESEKVSVDAQTPTQKTPQAASTVNAAMVKPVETEDDPFGLTAEEAAPATRQKPAAVAKPAKAKPELPTLPNLDDKKSAELPTPPASLTQPKTDSRRWVVQAASLSDEAKANALRDRLRAQGFAANVDTAVIKGRQVYRVRVGQLPDAQQAQATRAKINQSLNVQSIALPE